MSCAPLDLEIATEAHSGMAAHMTDLTTNVAFVSSPDPRVWIVTSLRSSHVLKTSMSILVSSSQHP